MKNLGLKVDTGTPLDQGKTRDIIAVKVGLGSGRTYGPTIS